MTPLPYHKLGHGANILLAFHGIGQDGLGCFQSFEEKLGNIYTIYAFDLFFHGESVNLDVDLITKNLWTQLIKDFLDQNAITHFDIAGFSMGGRFALATLEAFPEKIENAYLIAPDGISEHPLYTLASHFAPTRKLFKWCMQHPATFFKTISIARKTGLVNRSLARFTEQVLNTPEKRLTIYKSWIAFRTLQFDIPTIYRLIATSNIRVFLFTGKYDRLLKTDNVKRLSDLLPENQNIILKTGHTQLVNHAAVWICALFE